MVTQPPPKAMGNCLERRNRVRNQRWRSSEASPRYSSPRRGYDQKRPQGMKHRQQRWSVRYCPDRNVVILGNANGLAVVLK